MSIISKIKSSVESATGYTLHYYDENTINEVLTYNATPCAFMQLLKDTTLIVDASQNRERASVAVFFVNRTEFDFESMQNEAIIEAVKKKANTWLRSVMADGALKVIGDVKTARVYNEFDCILTGIAFNITLEEVYGFNACKDQEYEPTHTLNISDNGMFDVHEYYWVKVDIEGIMKEVTYTQNGRYEVTDEELIEKVVVNVNIPISENIFERADYLHLEGLPIENDYVILVEK